MVIVGLKFLLVLALVFLNGFFVAAEFAIVKIRETRLTELAAAGDFRARVASTLVKNLDAYLSATQLGITIASLGLGWMGEPLVSEQLEPLLHRIGLHNPTAVTTISVATGFFIITFLHIVFGELAPKSLAIQRTEGATLWTAIPLRVFYWCFFPMIWLLNEAATGALKLMGIEAASEKELAHSHSELVMILTDSARTGRISEQERKLSERALRFAQFSARMIMVPRNEIVYFSLSDPLEVSLAKAHSDNYARYPLCERGLDSVVGMVHIRDVLWNLREGKTDFKAVAREMVLVSEDETLERLLDRFRTARLHLALVVDETGSVSGLVTLEDVLEQLVGQIQDEFDREAPFIRKVEEEVYEISGRAPLALLHMRLGLEFNGGDAITLSGYVTEKMGRFPRIGDEVELNEWRLTVIRTEGIKAKTCRVEHRPENGKE